MFEEARYIERSINGDQQAFASLVDHYKDYIFSILISILKNRMDAEEAAQDSFVKIYKSLHKYESKSKFSSWIYSIAYRTGLDYLRKRKHTENIEDVDKKGMLIQQGGTALEELEKNDVSNWIQNNLNQLPPEEALLIRLFYFEELSVKELVEITGLSESNIKVKLYRGRKNLRLKLDSSRAKEINLLNN